MLAEENDTIRDAIRMDNTPLSATASLVQADPIASSSGAPRKRKVASGSGTNAHSGNSSPAPEAQAAKTVPARQIATGPLIPTFIPISEGSEYCTVDGVVLNHNGFRYTPACAAPPGSASVARTAESMPCHYRISWEDRNPALKVTADGLGVCGADGFRSARCNAPVREGKWYMEIAIEAGGGSRAPDSKRSQGAHVRVGWARREAALGGPAGMDAYGYAYRDATGDKVNISRPKPYGQPFGAGDVVGMYISLPPLRQPNKNDPNDPAHLQRERIAIQVGKDAAYFESKEYPVAKEMLELANNGKLREPEATDQPAGGKKGVAKSGGPRSRNNKGPKGPPPPRSLPILEGSRIAFFVNGVCQGTAFADVFDFLPLRSEAAVEANKIKRRRDGLQAHRDNPFDDGSLGYYPFISLFNEARVRLNPGPNFQYPPPNDIDALLWETVEDFAPMDEDRKPREHSRTWRPLYERYNEFITEQQALDEVDEERAKVSMARATKEAEQQEKVEVARAAKRTQANARKKTKTTKFASPTPSSTPGHGTDGRESPDVGPEGSTGGRATPELDSGTPMDDLEREASVLRSSATTPAHDYAPSPLRQQFMQDTLDDSGRYSPAAEDSGADRELNEFLSEDAEDLPQPNLVMIQRGVEEDLEDLLPDV